MSTLVVYSDTSDGYLVAGDYAANVGGPASADYSAARSGTSSLDAYTTYTGISVGQAHTDSSWYDSDLGEWVYSEQFWVDESFLSFDTSALTSGATVSAAVLRVTSYTDVSTTDFDIQARLRDWGTSLTTADWVAGADLSGLTLLGSYATSSGFTANTGYDLSDTAMAANVNKTGPTRMLLCSSRTTAGTAPTGDEYVAIRAADYTGTTRDPQLTVTYAAGRTPDGPGPTMDAVILCPSGTKTLTAAAIIKGSGGGSFTGNAAIKRNQPGSFAADAVLSVGRSGSLTAAAVIAKPQAGSFAANAVIAKTITGSLTSDAIRLRTFYFGSGPDPR